MDRAASGLAKLQNKAKDTGRSYQQCLQLFCQEEFLRRVTLSKYSDKLILKGGLFIYTLTNFESRATIDIDFLLRHIKNSKQDISRMMVEILNEKTVNEFISFEMKGISEIALQRKYKGVSVQLIAKISHTRTPVNVDIGIGDVVIPKPLVRVIPTQLEGFTKPEVYTYSLESTIAEKFDAMLQRLEFTSRMKDYFDIYYLATAFNFEGRELQEAIFETLQNRGTVYEMSSLAYIIEFINNEDMNNKWRLFLKKLKLTEPEFSAILNLLEVFLSPVYTAIINENEFFGCWDCSIGQWST